MMVIVIETDPKEIQNDFSIALLKSKKLTPLLLDEIQYQSVSNMKDMASLKHDTNILARV